MNAINPEGNAGSTPQHARGARFQTYGILLYLLVRYLECRDMEIIVEPSEGEDAKFVFSAGEAGGSRPVIELVQYKKREGEESDPQDSGTRQDSKKKGDDWKEETIAPYDLKKWVTKKRPHHSVEDILTADENTYFTAVVFGEVHPGAKAFIPEALSRLRMMGFTGYWSDFSKAFPPDYKHEVDPMEDLASGKIKDQRRKSLFGTKEVRQRVRLLRFASPSLLEVQCQYLLEEFYNTSRRLSRDVVDKLVLELMKHEAKRDVENRHILTRDIKAIIDSGRAGQGGWQQARKLLRQDSSENADTNGGELPRWIDFQEGRFTRFAEFDVALEALNRNGFILICGSAGVGKTTLANYLAYSFVVGRKDAEAYYLPAKPGQPLHEEIEFLKQHIGSEALFIVDEQHLAPDEVETLVSTFTAYLDLNKAKAKLLVVSNLTYGGAQNLPRSTTVSELSRATMIQIQPADDDKMRAIVSDLIDNLGLVTRLSADELVRLGHGNIGLALTLARCAQDLNENFSSDELFESKALGRALTRWIQERSGQTDDPHHFKTAVAPLFIIAAHHLPIPENFSSPERDYSKTVAALHAAGFLEPVPEDGRAGVTFRAANRMLARVINVQYSSQEFKVLAGYIKQYPGSLPILCERLKDNKHRRALLQELCGDNFGLFSETLNDPSAPVSLDEICKVLSALDTTERRMESARLLREMAAPNGQPRRRFFANFIHPRRASDASSVTNFFDTAYRIDRYTVKHIAAAELEDPERGDREIVSEFILGLFGKSLCNIDDIAACLRAIGNCARPYALELYERLQGSKTFAQKIAQADGDARSLYIWLRFCEQIKYLSRADCFSYLGQHLPEHKILQAVRESGDFKIISSFLLRLRRLHPILSIDIISELHGQDEGLLERLLRRERVLAQFTKDLSILSRLNRRLAITIAFQVQDHALGLIQVETHYNMVSKALDTMRKSIGVRIANEAAQAIDRDLILAAIEREQQRFSHVGLCLYTLSQVAPDVAGWFEQRLDYRSIIRKIRFNDLLLFHYIQIMRGFLAAASFTHGRKKELLDEFIGDDSFIRELHKGWEQARNMTELAFCLSQLMEIPVMKHDIGTLLGFPNLEGLKGDLLDRFRTERSTIHIANGLFAVAKFDLDTAAEALNRYVERVEGAARPVEKSPARGGARRRPVDRVRLPGGHKPNDLVDVGCLLRAAAAVETAQALKLAKLINLRTFVDYGASEANLGRLAVFILGLHEASRKLALEFVESTCSEERWQKQYDENDRMENVIHYARALGRVSRAKGSQYFQFILDRHKHEVERQLEAEANLALVSNWMRMLRLGGQTFVDQHVDALAKFLQTTAGYDTRLRHLLEATEALIECKQVEAARRFAAQALEEAGQMKSIHRLHEWITVLYKAARIGSELDMPDFAQSLFSGVKNWYFFTYILNFEDRPLLLACAYHLLQCIDVNNLRGEIQERQGAIIEIAESERRPVLRCLALILTQAPAEKIEAAAEEAEWYKQWERGLAAIAFSTIYPGRENPFYKQPDMPESDWQALLDEELNEHTGNLEFALTLHLAALTGLPEDSLERHRASALERAGDEMFGPTRWLLGQNQGAINLSQRPYYLWSYIKHTVLRSTYLTWESEVAGKAEGDILKQKHSPNWGELTS